MFNLQSYLDKLIQAKDSDFVKVLTGVRRCGKSTLLMLYKDWLLKRGGRPNFGEAAVVGGDDLFGCFPPAEAPYYEHILSFQTIIDLVR